MRHWITRLSAAGLCLSLLMGQAALASAGLGHDLDALELFRAMGDFKNRQAGIGEIDDRVGGVADGVLAHDGRAGIEVVLLHLAKVL